MREEPALATRTRTSWTPILIGIVLAAGAIVALRPGFQSGPPGRSQSKVYELTVNYQNIPGGVSVKIRYDATTVGLHLPDRSGFMEPLYYTARTVSLAAKPSTPGPGGSAVGQYQLIATITLYQYGQIVHVWEDSATVRNEAVLADTSRPPTG